MVHNGRVLTSLKYFCENAPEYHIVCAGSLLGIALRKQLSFPVGKVDFMTLYPMSYVEFLRACGEEKLADFIQSFKKGDAILIDKKEKYYWDAHCTIIMPCTPAWYPEQHKLVE